ncbi:MAG TPA: S53 family peptidase [Mycobacteriales bacterium]|nr:S53 family peptidase [Mycobacteriales bacterium]
MSHRARRHTAAIGLGGLLAAGIAAAPPAGAASPVEGITVFLRAPNAAGLDRLAAATGLTHAQRVRRLARLVPSSASQDIVASTLRHDGLSVGSQTGWSITAAGPRNVVASLFGSNPVLGTDPTVASLRAATGALPIVPAALSRYVAAAFPTTAGPAVFQHTAAVAGPGFRAAYTAPHRKPPGAGAHSDGRSTIATLQLADYSDSDLTTYAAKEGLPKIVGTSKYHQVAVDGGPTEADDSNGADIEVDLDQESILSTAPSANQRPYFAPNTNAGFDDVFASVFDDVVQNRHDNDGGDPNITALSSSWGGCESGYGKKAIETAQTMIKAVTAAGVTVFASSGDDGIYDCGTSLLGLGGQTPDVDYPASSPQVIGVGGTNLAHQSGTATGNNGHNWHEKAWSCTSANSCAGGLSSVLPVLPGASGGSGGGESGSAHSGAANSFAGFAEPAYQRTAIRRHLFANQKHRMVPDISADGDPATGFDLYTSDSTYASDENSRGLVEVGGTSLASPISAALFTNTLAAAHRHTGVGNIHGALYTAHRKDPRAFRDVTSGSNGAAADRGSDPSVSAHRGYDTVSGLGAALWPALTPYLLSKRKHHRH